MTHLPLLEFVALAAACAPGIPVKTLAPIVAVESGFNPLAINVNGEPAIKVRPQSKAEAVFQARRLIDQGRSVDLGLGQINSANLAWLGLSIEAAFEPCANIAAAGTVLRAGFRQARRRTLDDRQALLTALSYYNTGHPERGFANGYVAKVSAASRALQATPRPSRTLETPARAAETATPAPSSSRWDVFARLSADVFGRADVTAKP